MNYIDSQRKFCRFVAGHYVVMMRAWKNNEQGFGHRWVINNARYIGRKLVVVKVFKDAIQVQAINGREPFFVPWFVLEEFQEFQPVMPSPDATNGESKKDPIESIAEGMALKVANYSGVVTGVRNATIATQNLESGEMVHATDIRAADGCEVFVNNTIRTISENLGLNDPPKKLLSVIAIWKDGAVCQPTEKHGGKTGFVVTKHRISEEVFKRWHSYTDWSDVFWLDETTPTELTPKEAFELYKVIYPKIDKIFDGKDGSVSFHSKDLDSIINWGNTTEYPPRERWRVATDDDKGSKCRAWCSDKRQWVDATFVSTWEDVFIVKSGYSPFPIEVQKCEVLDDEPN